ncbi:cysteine peptidase family C39 domain-containing protein [bacterium]|nr:cysteine peptidase family C39 domain-containing protein [bacterium]
MPLLQHDPLVDCLLYVAHYHRLAAIAESLTAALPVAEQGLTPDLLLRAADRAGLNTRLTHLSLDQIPDAVCPAIVLLEDSACVYLGAGGNATARVIYPQPIDTEVNEPVDALSARATGHVLLARPRFKLDSKTAGYQHIHRASKPGITLTTTDLLRDAGP